MKPTYEVKNTNDLNKFLAGVLKDLRNKKADKEEVESITKIANQITRNNQAAIAYEKLPIGKQVIEFFEQ